MAVTRRDGSNGFCLTTQHTHPPAVRHQSPERLLGLRCSFASDIWSFGILARFLAVGVFPLPIQEPPSALAFKSLLVHQDVPPLPIFPLGHKPPCLPRLPSHATPRLLHARAPAQSYE